MREDYQAVLEYAGFSKKIIGFPAGPVILLLKVLEYLKLSPLYEWVYETASRDSFVSIAAPSIPSSPSGRRIAPPGRDVNDAPSICAGRGAGVELSEPRGNTRLAAGSSSEASPYWSRPAAEVLRDGRPHELRLHGHQRPERSLFYRPKQKTPLDSGPDDLE